MIAFTVPGEPASKARARVVNGHAFTPARTVRAEADVLCAYLAQSRRQPHTGPVWMDVTFYCFNKRRRDLDNMIKLVSDALNGHAYTDDSQIVDLRAKKTMVATKDDAHTYVRIDVAA